MPRNLFICDNNQHLYMQAFNIEIIDNQQFVIISAEGSPGNSIN